MMETVMKSRSRKALMKRIVLRVLLFEGVATPVEEGGRTAAVVGVQMRGRANGSYLEGQQD
jgi:hypothetical protein